MVSNKVSPEFITAEDGTRLAFYATAATHPNAGPGVVFLGGFMSDMTGQKATVLESWAQKSGRGFLRLDYSGHGSSGGEFRDGTIGRWLSDAVTVIRHVGATVDGLGGELVLVGSSMGGWIAALVAMKIDQQGVDQRVAGLVTIAAATDFTKDLLPARLGPDALAQIQDTGFFEAPSQYASGTYVITRHLLEEGQNHILLTGALALNIPVRLIHGTADPDVPWTQSQKLMNALTSSDVELILIKDGDHRLSEPTDLHRITNVLAQLCDQLSASNAANPAR
ncbi:MAG: alpha/beta fold hydrolase [Alphaproteobacteria bacterium]|nr:alpha/beta fold hydrolase [Alphaproteobacteria bacterium]